MRNFSAIASFVVLASTADAQFGPVTTVYPAATTTLGDLVDVDGDGTRDLVTIEALLGNHQFSLRWSKGRPDASFAPSQSIAVVPGQLFGLTTESQQVSGGDLDGDGFVELLVATTQGLVLLDGTGTGQFAAPRNISPGPCAHTEVLDLDLDGDLDVVKGAFGSGNQASTPLDFLFINDGSGALTPRSVTGTCCYYDTPLFTDADLDGDLDMLLQTGSSQQTSYYQNLGGLSFAAPTALSALGSTPFLSLADVDQDGDDDLLYAHFNSNPGGWVENNGGQFTGNHVVTGLTISLSAPRVADMDGDGDMDFVFVQDVFGTSWYPNDGNHLFPQQLPINLPIVNASVIDLVDINGDRALDILFASDNPRGIAAHLNIGELGAITCNAAPNSTGGPATLRASGSRSAAANQFALTLGNAPTGQFAAFLVGRSTQLSTLPGSAGVLCLGAPFGIFRGLDQIQATGAGGTLFLPIDLGAIPSGAGFQAVQSGETWIFQSLFRDPTPIGASNLSPGVAVTFVP